MKQFIQIISELFRYPQFLSNIYFCCICGKYTEKWKPLSKELKSKGHELVCVEENLVDLLWSDRPDRPCNDLIILSEEETGVCSIYHIILDNIRAKVFLEITF